mmetsp:Transcript_56686/g.99139  ORF Transcript_56686/g.99139 Transcript_56686/m.99139 type:complete len:144 (-) Transcript_56686:246-677(-)
MFTCCAATGADEKAEVMGIQDPEAKGEEEAAPVTDPVVESAPEPEKEAPPAPAEPAPEPTGLQFGFLSDAGVKYVTVTSKPLGLQFEKKMPIIVSGFSEGSKAKELGVGVGWEMKSVGGEDLTGIEKYSDAFAIISKYLKTLQ